MNIPPPLQMKMSSHDEQNEENRLSIFTTSNLSNQSTMGATVGTSTNAWSPCCQTEHRSKSFFSFPQSGDQHRAKQQYIDRSLAPDFSPCRSCAHDLLRRYNDPHRKVISECVHFTRIRPSYIEEILGLTYSNTNTLSIHNLSTKALVQLGLTCGAFDFVDVVMKSMIHGQKLLDYITKNKCLWNGTNIFRELQTVVHLLQSLKFDTNELYSITRTLNEIETQDIDHVFINNKLEFNTKEYGERLRKAGGVFGHLGKTHGIKGKDCGGKAAECARVGKEKGGRPKGSKNAIDLTIEFCLFVKICKNSAEMFVKILRSTLSSYPFLDKIVCNVKYLRLNVRMLNDDNEEIRSRIVYILKRANLEELKQKLYANRQGFKYEDQTLFFEQDPTAPNKDIPLTNDAQILCEIGISDLQNDIYFFEHD